jgi:hypothetical protein
MRRTTCRGRVAKTVASDDPTVWVGTPSVYPTLSLNQDRDAPRQALQHRMNRRTVDAQRRSSSVREPQQLSDVGGASDEPMLLKSRRRFIRRSTFQRVVSQRLAECLGLFIPPPLAHLRLLDCVEVQESSRHLEDHIQSIQVLNCSSIAFHMLSVCA